MNTLFFASVRLQRRMWSRTISHIGSNIATSQLLRWNNIRSLSNTSNDDRELIITRLSGINDGITLLSMNRTKVRNALGKQLINEFTEAISELSNDNSTRVIVIESTVDKVFCAGADLKERRNMTDEESRTFVTLLRQTFTNIEKLPQPVIASIDGAAFGGGLELALACDLRVAGLKATFGLVETSLAIIPGAGGTQRLPRLIPKALAKELIFTSKRFGTKDAFKYGLLNKINENENETSRETSLELAREILPNGPIGVRMAKKAINEGLDAGSMENGMLVEQECYEQVLPTMDRLEALKAFQEKRKPVFIGK